MSEKDIVFVGKHPEEVVIFLQRRHVALLLGRMLRWVFLAIIPGAVLLLVSQFSDSFRFDIGTTSGILLTLGGGAYLLVLLLLGFQDWVDYYLDALILTNERVLRIEQKGIMNRVVSQLTLDRIQDVSVETKGMLATMLGFGKLTIETAGEQERFVFDAIPHAESVQAKVLMYARQAPRMGVEQPAKPPLKFPTTGTPG